MSLRASRGKRALRSATAFPGYGFDGAFQLRVIGWLFRKPWWECPEAPVLREALKKPLIPWASSLEYLVTFCPFDPDSLSEDRDLKPGKVMPKQPSPAGRSSRHRVERSKSLRSSGVATSKAGKSRAKNPRPADSEPAPIQGLPFPVVGIGASAGGFEALMMLLKHMPVESGMAFVVVLHLDPRHKSKLTELVSRATTMTVREIKDDMLVEPNNIYVLPANLDVILSNKRLKLVRRPESERLHMPIDHFFQSLAVEQGSRAIGVVLSGTGSDGTVGCTAIKAESGITYAEAEASAKYFGMPRSAIDAGCVDAVYTPDALASELTRIARHPFVRPRRTMASEEPFPKSIDALGKIFFLLKQHCGVNFSLYKHSTLKRRISRRMVLQRIEKVDDYVNLLRSSPEEIEALFHDLLINVTTFFRDRKAYNTLKKRVVSRIIKSKGEQGEIRVWVPGCATGEEVYSLAICLMEEVSRVARNIKIQVFGTDLSEMAISKARVGVYAPSIVKDVSPERLRRFFSRVNGAYQISRVIRDMCTFARQNICEDPPFSRLDLISCRNVLIYLGPELQKKCMPIFHYALNPGGFLLLGTSESIGVATDLFELMDKKHKIYSRKSVPQPANLDFAVIKGQAAAKPELGWREMPRRQDIETGMDLQRHAERIVLARYAPAGVIVDRQLRVHEFRGSTSRYLEHAPGIASLNLLQMVRPSLIVDLRTAIHKALKEHAPARKDGVVLKVNGHDVTINLQIIPFTVPPANEIWLLILFEEFAQPQPPEVEKRRPSAVQAAKSTRRPHDPEVGRLRTELDATKESLQAIIEEQEATNEELKPANEEIESSNEELQSTNEELETAKEELQSTNEELTTLNEELSNRNIEMAQMNNDLTNLLSSINIPILMVDNSLSVRRATPMAERLFNLIPTDIGRRLSDLKANLHITNLDQMIRDVIDTLTAREAKVQDHDSRWYSLRIRPYRTRDNKIDGAVATLVDIDEEQRSIARLESASQYSDAIMETIREPLLVLGPDLRVRKANRSFYDKFRLSRRKTETVPLYELGNGEWNLPELRKLLEEILPRNRRLENFKVEQDIPGHGRRTFLLNARRVENKSEHLILLALGDSAASTGSATAK